ncbi:MAG TPA: adenine deaminase [Flavobacteriales bacterium]|nr:adenine deaminase [Flavobacteriales bacterium]HIN39364.1 adenine deaminase [Flavobacteriales bacterium]
MDTSEIYSGIIADVKTNRFFKGSIEVQNGKIINVLEKDVDEEHFILPGFIDAHIHIESSMLVPSEFARLAVVHGTVATISDPHEIANVMGIDGVRYMINNGNKVPFNFYFGAPSCVPATIFETAGATIDLDQVKELLAMKEIRYLSEMMNFPGVLLKDETVMKKIQAAKDLNKVIDGHAPGLRGENAKKYIEAGISTDHECFTKEEALDKLKYGMKIIIREGSAAKNFDALISLLDEYPEKIMFCSDDKHPNELEIGHINLLAKRAVAQGSDVMNVIKACTINVVDHYGLDVGLIQKGDNADFIITKDLKNFEVMSTYIKGSLVAQNGISLIKSVKEVVINQFNCNPIMTTDIVVKAESNKIHVIEAYDGQLITNDLILDAKEIDGNLVSEPGNDILKLVVLNRYSPTPPTMAFVRNFGMKKGAIASSVAHDSHNIIAVGASDIEIVNSINLLVASKGGISLVNGEQKEILELPVAGLMTTDDGYKTGKTYDRMDQMAKALGSKLSAPYMTLSFLALLVIPKLKLSDKGLFDGEKFQFTSLYVD